jgi:lipopolysaccharide/colanic/teichoic acid biosynthesis glycosyltransferase
MNNNNQINNLVLDNKSNQKTYWVCKRIFDITISFILLPLLLIIFLILYFLNFIYNPGTVFYVQNRMGKDCKVFQAIKFRSMISSDIIQRGHDDPIEESRILPLGKFLRKTRIDEIPQIINIIQGDMSLIGPRPDFYEHAIVFQNKIDDYHKRYIIRPGITGLAQIRLGYAVGLEETKNKTKLDLHYIKNAGFFLDVKIIFGTIFTVLFGLGK